MKDFYGINDLNIPQEWIDTSWGNDAMYSYEIGDVRIWIDTVDPKKSECFDAKREYFRFCVVTSDSYNDKHNDHFCDDVLLESNDFDEIVAFVNKKK